jgi:hypothetical protein
MFTAAELQNITNSVLEFHVRGKAESQIIQDRPLYNDLRKMAKEFAGGNEYITVPVKGQYTTEFAGYSHDDEVSYSNPANIKRAKYKWFELSAGIQVTLTELKMAGISVVDSMSWGGVSRHSERELFVLTEILDDKIEDMQEGSARSFADMLWRDGTQDAKAVPGVRSLILTAPSTGTTGGLDRAANSWWRNRASVSIDSSTASNQNLVNTLQKEFRQLRRYGKNPKHRMYAGSDFMDAFEKELRSKGNYTLEGWAKSKTIDASIADIAFKGIEIQYEPLLDDLGLSKYCYVLDLNAIKLMPMQGEADKIHTPARPAEKYVIYRAVTWTGALCASQLNTSGVYAIQ